MLHPGMPTAPGTLAQRPDGSLAVQGLNLSMAGDWVLTVSASQKGASQPNTASGAELPFRVDP